MSKLTPKNKPISSATAGNYAGLLADIKQRIRTAQVRTAMAGNASMLMLYWEIGGVLAERQKAGGWGAGVLPRLATDLHNDLAELKGFSARNLRLMIQFFGEYPDSGPIWQRAVANLADDPTGGKKRPPPVGAERPPAGRRLRLLVESLCQNWMAVCGVNSRQR